MNIETSKESSSAQKCIVFQYRKNWQKEWARSFLVKGHWDPACALGKFNPRNQSKMREHCSSIFPSNKSISNNSRECQSFIPKFM